MGALPEEGERPVKTRRKISVDGWEKEEEEEGASSPNNRETAGATLLMCLAAFPQFFQFNLKKEDLDAYYDWFYGPEVGAAGLPHLNIFC